MQITRDILLRSLLCDLLKVTAINFRKTYIVNEKFIKVTTSKIKTLGDSAMKLHACIDMQ